MSQPSATTETSTATTTDDFVEIDGGHLEGGGQILRNSVAYSALLRRPLKVKHIRNNRTPPGLKPQHAAGLRLAAELCDGELLGCEKGSREITFVPKEIRTGRSYVADPGTAGAITLLLQVSLPCIIFSSSAPLPRANGASSSSPNSEPHTDALTSLTLRGGTNATDAPQIDYILDIFVPFIKSRFGLAFDTRLERRGFFPRGGGEVRVTARGIHGPIQAIQAVDRGKVLRIRGRSYVAGVLPIRLSHQMKAGAMDYIRSNGFGEVTDVEVEVANLTENSASGSGSGIILWAETEGGYRIGGTSIGSKKKVPYEVGKAAAEELVRNLKEGGCVDEWLQDQIIIFMALAEGRSNVRAGPLTLHTKTAIWVAEQLTEAKFEVEDLPPDDGGGAIISCSGIAYKR